MRINKNKTRVKRLKNFLLEPKDWTFGARLVLVFVYGLILIAVAATLIETSAKLIVSNGFLLGISTIIVTIVKFTIIVIVALVFTILAIFIVSLFVSILSNIVINIYVILKNKIKK